MEGKNIFTVVVHLTDDEKRRISESAQRSGERFDKADTAAQAFLTTLVLRELKRIGIKK